MPNPEHVEWLLEGVDRWNRRRKNKFFRPDLSGENIYWKFRKAGISDNDKFVLLSHVDLSWANLRGTIFSSRRTNAGADLRHAILKSSDLTNAHLANSKLDEADFQEAILDEANLNGSDLHGADLSKASLAGTNLSLSSPWKAKLYHESDPKSSSYQDIKYDKQIECVADLLEVGIEFDANCIDAMIYYRGEGSNEWDLRPSAMRCTGQGGYSFRTYESDMLLDLISRRPNDFNVATSALDQWVLAQHHKLNTRLLDITRNPLVALFAACELQEKTGRLHVFMVPKELVKSFNSDTISIVANFCKLSREEQVLLLGLSVENIKHQGMNPEFEFNFSYAMNRLYHLIRQEQPNFEKLIDPRDFFRVFVVEPQQSFERIRAQSGAFLISAFHERLEQQEVLQWNSKIPIYHHLMIEVPKESKNHIIDELRLLNITRETLYPGLDESAKAITDRYREKSDA